MSKWREEIIGECRLILGDCRTIDVEADVCLTDPPYGIGYNPSGGDRNARRGNLPPVVGDDSDFDPSPLLDFDEAVLWGANHFANKLPNRGRWLVWDKRDGTNSNDMADCEMAWTSDTRPARLFSHRWMGMIRASERGETRVHPTQKPVALMDWCLSFTEGETVFDPYMGSGTVGISCVKAGRKFIGCEIEPKYFDIACRRIERAYSEQALFAGVNA